jgi:hypothetical protein
MVTVNELVAEAVLAPGGQARRCFEHIRAVIDYAAAR